MKKGKLFVIDGTDGSGKETQIKLVIERLKNNNIKVKTLDFPRYYDNFFGEFIGECLRGDHGDFVHMDPKIASILYAADRFESSKQIQEWIDQGYIVLVDRYTSASQIHQGGKIKDEKERNNFLEWLDKLEYGIFKIPQPDLIIFFDVPVEISQKLIQNKDTQKTKAYLKGKKDQVEINDDYAKNSLKSAYKLADDNENWRKIKCTENGEMLSREKISDLVWEEVEKII